MDIDTNKARKLERRPREGGKRVLRKPRKEGQRGTLTLKWEQETRGR